MLRNPPYFALLTCLWLLAGLPAFAQGADGPDPEDPGEIIREILKLQRRIDDLMALLPLERRAEVEELLEGHRRGTGAVAEAGASETVESSAPADAEASPAEPAEPTGYGSTITVVGREDCNLLRPFDFDDDDLIGTRDRYWRYLALWRDADGDGEAQESELTDLYEAGIQDVAVDLGSFRYADGGAGRIDLGRFIRLGIDDRPFGEAPVLTVDTSRLARGTGPQVFAPGSDEPLKGVQPIERGWRLRWDDGRTMVLTCE